MHLSFILSSLWLSGGVRVIVEYANRLTERGHTISLITPKGTVDPDISRELTHKVQIIESKEKRITASSLPLRNAIKLSTSLARAVPSSDIIFSTHAPTTAAGFIATKILKRGRSAWLYQDYLEMFNDRSAEQWLIKKAWHWHSLIMVVSQSAKDELLRFSKNQIVVVGEGLSHTKYFKPAKKRANHKGPKNILYLGDMRPRKGLFDFLEASSLLHKKDPNITLTIISKEDCNIDTQVPFKYIYRPSRSALAKLYQTCDLFVSASWWESFGLPPLEAMACGAPVVLTNSRGVLEYAEDDVNCLMTPIKNPPALAESMYKVLHNRDLSEKLRLNAQAKAKMFSWDTAVDRFENYLQDI